jgi:carboxyl-terminal processing protease
MRSFARNVIVLTMLLSPQVFAQDEIDDIEPPEVVAPAKTAAKKSGLNSNEKYNDIALFSRVLNFVEKQYVKEVDSKKLVFGAIKGMLESLDPHSAFLTPEIYAQMRNDTTGKFGGLGIEIWLGDDGLLTIVHPMEDTPAWRAGIRSGDKIIRIDGEATKGLSLIEAVTKMRGKVGSPITLTIYRDSADEVKDFKIVRSIIKVKSIASQMLKDNYGYIRLNHFQEKSAREMLAALEELEKKAGGKDKLAGLVLDLRNNPGGLLDEAVDVTNLFIDEGVIVSTIGRNQEEKEIRRARSGTARKNLSLAVLVNGNSASAAEIVAGALKDHNRALLLGGRTFGKGSVQTVIPLNDDMGLKLTIALYYTPAGISIQAKGITPHVFLDDVDSDLYNKAKKKSSTLREADLRNHFDEENLGSGKRDRKIEDYADKRKKDSSKEREADPDRVDPERDLQVQQALSYLRSYDFFKNIKEGTVPAAPATAPAAIAPAETKKSKPTPKPRKNTTSQRADTGIFVL